MKKRTVTMLGVLLFIISIAVCGGIFILNNDYSLDDYLAKICGGDSEEMKCVYMFVEYNPFNYSNTFYYQVTTETLMDSKVKDVKIIQEGAKSSIDGILKVANSHNADNWIELGEDKLLVYDRDNFKRVNKGDNISKDELITIVNNLNNE